MSTYLGIPRPSALLLGFEWSSLGAKLTQNVKKNGIQSFRTFLEGDFGQFPRDFIEFVGKWLGVLTENVAMVLIKVLPNSIQFKSIRTN